MIALQVGIADCTAAPRTPPPAGGLHSPKPGTPGGGTAGASPPAFRDLPAVPLADLWEGYYPEVATAWPANGPVADAALSQPSNAAGSTAGAAAGPGAGSAPPASTSTATCPEPAPPPPGRFVFCAQAWPAARLPKSAVQLSARLADWMGRPGEGSTVVVLALAGATMPAAVERGIVVVALSLRIYNCT